MPLVSVIICTHNPRPDYLRRTVEGLRRQSLHKDQWELLLIDNASKEHLAKSWDLAWHPQARHVREEEPGLTPARLRGISESKGEILVFVDDDNVLVSDYLETAVGVAQTHPYLGAFGAGKLEPEFEIEPPAELRNRLPLLALRSVSEALWTNNINDSEATPWGAGLCVTRRMAECYREVVNRLKTTSLLDRRGQHLFCGGDDVFSWVSATVGRGFGIFPRLRVTHLIAAGRLTQSYFLRLIHDHSFSHGILRYMWSGAEVPSAGLLEHIRVILHGLRNGLFSARCQWAELQGRQHTKALINQRRLEPIRPKALLAPSRKAVNSSSLTPNATHIRSSV